MSSNQVDTDQMLQNAASDLDLHCLLRSDYLNTYGKCGSCHCHIKYGWKKNNEGQKDNYSENE